MTVARPVLLPVLPLIHSGAVPPLGQKSGRVYKALPGPLRARAGADPLGPGDYTLIALARSVSPLTSRRWPAAGLRHAPPGVGPLTRGASRLFCRPFPPLLILSRATPLTVPAGSHARARSSSARFPCSCTRLRVREIFFRNRGRPSAPSSQRSRPF